MVLIHNDTFDTGIMHYALTWIQSGPQGKPCSKQILMVFFVIILIFFGFILIFKRSIESCSTLNINEDYRDSPKPPVI